MISFHSFTDELCKIAATQAVIGRMLKSPKIMSSAAGQASISKRLGQAVSSSATREAATPMTASGMAQGAGSQGTKQLLGQSYQRDLRVGQSVGTPVTRPAMLTPSPQHVAARGVRTRFTPQPQPRPQAQGGTITPLHQPGAVPTVQAQPAPATQFAAAG